MSQAYQQKLDRYTARYPDGPMDARHVLELFAGLHDLLSVLAERVTILEEKLTRLAPPPHEEPRGT